MVGSPRKKGRAMSDERRVEAHRPGRAGHTPTPPSSLTPNTRDDPGLSWLRQGSERLEPDLRARTQIPAVEGALPLAINPVPGRDSETRRRVLNAEDAEEGGGGTRSQTPHPLCSPTVRAGVLKPEEV